MNWSTKTVSMSHLQREGLTDSCGFALVLPFPLSARICARVITCQVKNTACFGREKQQPLCVSTCVFPAGGRLILQATLRWSSSVRPPHKCARHPLVLGGQITVIQKGMREPLVISTFADVCLEVSLNTRDNRRVQHFPPDCPRPLVCSNSRAPFSPVEYMCCIFLISLCHRLRALYLHSPKCVFPVSMVSFKTAPPHFYSHHYSVMFVTEGL